MVMARQLAMGNGQSAMAPAVVLDFVLVESVPLPPGCVAWWPAGGNVQDAQGNHDGTLVNGAGFAAGAVGQAFELDGTNAYLSVPDDAAWTLGTNDFTLEFWVNFRSLATNELGLPEAIFVGHDEGGGSLSKWFFALGERLLNFHVNSPALGAQFLVQAPFDPALDTWYHLAVVRTGTNVLVYTNGVAAGADTFPDAIPDAAAPLTLGQAEGLGYLDGWLDEVTLYSRALDAGNYWPSMKPAARANTIQSASPPRRTSLAGGPATARPTISPGRIPPHSITVPPMSRARSTKP
jgi:hypothetical protein